MKTIAVYYLCARACVVFCDRTCTFEWLLLPTTDWRQDFIFVLAHCTLKWSSSWSPTRSLRRAAKTRISTRFSLPCVWHTAVCFPSFLVDKCESGCNIGSCAILVSMSGLPFIALSDSSSVELKTCAAWLLQWFQRAENDVAYWSDRSCRSQETIFNWTTQARGIFALWLSAKAQGKLITTCLTNVRYGLLRFLVLVSTSFCLLIVRTLMFVWNTLILRKSGEMVEKR